MVASPGFRYNILRGPTQPRVWPGTSQGVQDTSWDTAREGNLSHQKSETFVETKESTRLEKEKVGGQEGDHRGSKKRKSK